VSLDPSFVGRCYPAAGVYQVGREKIREFAEAIGDDSELYRDPSAARACGYSDVIAPPTFAFIVALQARRALFCDSGLGLDCCRVVHGKQSFTHHRPIQAGDELAVTLHVEDVCTWGGNEMLTVRCQITDTAGDPVATARSLLFIRGEDR
jgi:acyl dehydratase